MTDPQTLDRLDLTFALRLRELKISAHVKAGISRLLTIIYLPRDIQHVQLYLHLRDSESDTDNVPDLLLSLSWNEFDAHLTGQDFREPPRLELVMLEKYLNSADRVRVRQGMHGKLPKLMKLGKLEIVYATHVIVSDTVSYKLI